ncbi:hypothetical protein PVAP13_8NG347600 [Panicum virgatum]|uniref:NB-ARC domain-containing protein n=2 Tax=Panicum virgatum TaxID=38727 RepID=A0A8T0PK72_PANVG|nr:hypothetical protein PVAP13_8NG347600 [Panicum virgatum]
MPVWDRIRAYLPDTKHGSRIVVSTHQLEIASLCTGNPYQVSELGQFSEDHYVLVFFKDHNAQHSEGFLRDEVKYQKRSSFVREVANDWKNNCFLVGRDREVHELGEMIRDCFYRNEAYVVSVCGTAGVGKSSIVQAVYNHFVANRNHGMFERFGWVSGSHPLDPMDFSQRLLLDMEAGESSYVEVPTRYAIEACTDVLCRYRCLIVIDGLQFKEDWYSIYHNILNLSNMCGICIIVITTEDSFLEGARSADRVFHIKPLEDDIAFDLFRKVLPFETVMNENVLEEVKSLLSKCGGLPKQIIALASHLGPLLQRPRGIQERDRARLTANFMHELAMAKRDSMQSIFALMRSSFEGCPQLLRRCIFYLRIFPENSYIRRRRLVRRWMAEGYSKSIGSHSLEDDAEKLFDKIAALGMIQQAQRMTAMADVMRTAPWQVNYLFLEYIISWQEEEKIFLPLEVSVLEGRCSLSTGRIGQHLSIGNSWERDEFVFDSLDSSRLRSLTVYGGWRSFFISNKMRVLRVLDLEGSSNLNDGDLDQIGEMVPHLKFLSLRRCTPISQLPDSLGLLKQLQTLDIRYSSIVVLPKCIVNLRKLQHLSAGTVRWDSIIPDVSLPAAGQLSRLSRSRARHLVPWLSKLFRSESVSSHNGGVKVPGGIATLKALHTLSVVDANASGGGSLLGDLKMLSQLRKLGVSGITEENTRIWDLRFPPNTIKLSLEMAMDWIPRHIIQAAGKLQSLDTLRIKGIGGELEFEGSGGLDEGSSSFAGPFGELKVLQIDFRGDSSLRFEPGSMRKLEQLKVILGRGGSRLRVDGIVCLISLKQVWVKGPLDVEHREQLVRQLDLHGGRPVLKLEE